MIPIKAAAEHRNPNVQRPNLQPFSVRVHVAENREQKTIEVRPRVGTWSPFFAAVPIEDKERLNFYFLRGGAGHPPCAGGLFGTGEGPSEDGVWWLRFAQDEATPTQSYFIFCRELPAELAFGVHNGSPQYCVTREFLEGVA